MKAADLHLTHRLRRLASAAAWLLAACSAAAIAANTDIANAPLFTSSSAQIKPNIMFILDDSGSMKDKFIPDEANFSTSIYGFRASQCNGVAYDPKVVYNPPVDATGTMLAVGPMDFMEPSTQTASNASADNPLTANTTIANIAGSQWPTGPGVSVNVTVTGNFGNSSYVADGTQEVTVFGTASQFFIGVVTAWNGNTGAMTIKVWDVVGSGALNNGHLAKGVANTYFTYSGTQAKLGYSYDASATLVTNSVFYKECSSPIGSTPGSTVFTPHAVGSTSAEAQNYANWYKYYRTRMDMMKTAMTWAFRGIDDRYRVGYSTISSTTAVEGSGTVFLNIRDFDATQKAKFYTDLNAATPSISTPLRGALAKAGQYYANKAPGQTVDPVQYSCQRNFTLLSTDGYWNTFNETSTYGPFQLDGTTKVGQQDGGATPRPMFDGGSITATTTETWSRNVTRTSTISTPRITTTTSVVSSASITAATNFSRQNLTTIVPVWTLSGTSFTRNSSGVVTVTTSGPHNLVTGDTITVTTTSTNAFTQGFATSQAVVTRISDTQFSYFSPGSAGTGTTTNTNVTLKPTVSASCSAGNGVSRTFVQIKNGTYTVSTVTTTTVKPSTSTVTTTSVDTTPFTRTIKVVNGVTVSDSTVAGTTTTNDSNSSPNVTDGTPSATSSTSTGTATSVGGTFTTIPGVETATGTTCQGSGTNTFGTSTSTTTVSGEARTSSTVADGTPVTTPLGTVGPADTPNPHASSTVTTTSGGAENTLADVAMYYYKTDLRNAGLGNCTGASGANVCQDNVPPSGASTDAAHSFGDSANWQHMTTFTLGLGASGLLRYTPDYLTQKSGDFFNITNAGLDWPTPSDTASGGGPQNIDDLWHAAVNGRGQYFSAGDPGTLTDSLNSALTSIGDVSGSSSSASTSSLQPVQGDNDIYVAQFTTQDWFGDVLSFKIDPTTGQISSTVTWSAKAQLDSKTAASRTIYYANPNGSSTLRAFSYANLATDGYSGLFDGFCSKTGANGSGNPQQCAALPAAQRDAANLGSNLVNYLRGDATQSYYRTRQSPLGDIINASPLFIGKPGFRYTENNYQAFVTANANRQAIVLAAANDGMVHAFDRATGNELWAYVPSFVMRNMYKLADKNYANYHAFFVDGSPQMGDIFVGGAWKTIVVGGLNAGGRGYYALDVTDPANPKLLWEFGAAQNPNLGLSFGNPIITKRANGTWVVVFASGYNNVSPGDGNGHLFVLDANTGTPLKDIQTFSSGTTPAGSSTTPSGLAKINDWVDSETVNSAKRFYGGDMLGNLWRFDIDSIVAPNNAALRLAQLTGPTGAAQPVTTKPAVAEVSYNGSRFPVVYVATGRYLGTSDLSDNNVQSLYAMKDPLIDQSYGVVRSNPSFVTQTITANNNDRTSSGNKVDWITKSGWMVNLPAGERVSVNPALAGDTLFVGSNLPNTSACTVGGDSFLYQFNIASGTSTSSYLAGVMIQGLTLVQLTTGSQSGSVVSIITRSDGKLQTIIGTPSTTTTNLRRASWRELTD